MSHVPLTLAAVVIISGIGAAIWAILIAVWASSFTVGRQRASNSHHPLQSNRVSWGAMGDEMTMVIPKGRA